jgi:hypothetical protein
MVPGATYGRILGGLGVACFAIGCTTRIAPADDSALGDELRGAYRSLAEGTSAFMHVGVPDPALPAAEVDSIYSALVRLHAHEDPRWLPARSIFDAAAMGRAADFAAEARTVTVFVDGGDTRWDPWRTGEQQTGDPEIDSVLRRFGLSVRSWTPYSLPRIYGVDLVWLFVLDRQDAFNPSASAAAWRRVAGVLDTSPDPEWELYRWGNWYPVSGAFDDPNVGYRPEPGPLEWRLRVALGWGDCPAGCINNREYDFRIAPDGAVRLAPDIP